VYGSRGLHPKDLIWPPDIEELNLVAQDPSGVPLGLESVAIEALFLQRLDQVLDHPVVLRAMCGDEFLAQAVAANHVGVQPRREDEAVIRAQQEGSRHAPQRL
jgi:hypothetical protein